MTVVPNYEFEAQHWTIFSRAGVNNVHTAIAAGAILEGFSYVRSNPLGGEFPEKFLDKAETIPRDRFFDTLAIAELSISQQQLDIEYLQQIGARQLEMRPEFVVPFIFEPRIVVEEEMVVSGLEGAVYADMPQKNQTVMVSGGNR